MCTDRLVHNMPRVCRLERVSGVHFPLLGAWGLRSNGQAGASEAMKCQVLVIFFSIIFGYLGSFEFWYES